MIEVKFSLAGISCCRCADAIGMLSMRIVFTKSRSLSCKAYVQKGFVEDIIVIEVVILWHNDNSPS